ncbi:MAG: dihydrofolate reductase [Proteobacteria bacterium]|nr:dihydrofolate reductase [Pseudomonadota bacterium]NBX86719.1 dihydrofolate reductase [Pseudomonadota bacterium]
MISLIVAMGRNGVIGANGGLPWHLPADMRRLREITWGKTLVMGRKTFESLPPKVRPLPGRRNLVLTRDATWAHAGAERVAILAEAVALAGENELVVFGGAEVYALAMNMNMVEKMYVTEVDVDVAGDTYFPTWNKAEWREVAHEQHEENGVRYAWIDYVRQTNRESR